MKKYCYRYSRLKEISNIQAYLFQIMQFLPNLQLTLLIFQMPAYTGNIILMMAKELNYLNFIEVEDSYFTVCIL